jgi:hypothetical protein
MTNGQFVNEPFWKSDWGKIIKIFLSAVTIGAIGGIVWAFFKRNRELAPNRMVNGTIAQTIADKTKMSLTRYPDKNIGVLVSVADIDRPFATNANHWLNANAPNGALLESNVI